ncbi:glutaminase A [Demequina aurantiaca]|uniref:glutaminase A n=1 Tax=Demequina aurantiaca TaxID=676200 RepID=UPI003D32D416
MNQEDPLRFQTVLDRARSDHSDTTAGTVSAVYPGLSEVDPGLFGIAVTEVDGRVTEVGDAGVRFALMSCAKPFVFALVCQTRGLEEVRATVGVNATGLPFNSSAAVERDPASRTNPMVNSGALATIALVPGASVDEQWQRIAEVLSGFAGRTLTINESMYSSVSQANHRNRSLAHLLFDRGALAGDPDSATELYTRVSCLEVTARDLSVMGATLANRGVSPVTGARVVDAGAARSAVAVMATAGLYETSGDWLLDVGLPAKSGIGGGIVTVAPGTLGLGTYAPRLDAAGNSIKGQLVAKQVARDLELDIFATPPEA